MIRITILLFLPAVPALPTPSPAPDPKPPHIFQALNCMGHNRARVKTFYGSSPADCNHAEIFQTPVTKAAQIITVPPLHPLEAIHCLVKVKIYTATCGRTQENKLPPLSLQEGPRVNFIHTDNALGPIPVAASHGWTTAGRLTSTPPSRSSTPLKSDPDGSHTTGSREG